MKTQTKNGLFLIEYKNKWYYNENGHWYPWFELSENINWSITTTTSPTRRVFKIPVGNLSRKKANKLVKKISKSYKKDLWFPDDRKLQIEITRYIRKEKLKQIEECQNIT